MKALTVIFFAYGHKNVIATHKTTFEITKAGTLSRRGDCIVAVKSTKAAFDLPIEFKEAMRKERTQIIITIEANELKETIKAKGTPKLQLTHPTDLVIRKSDYVCERTLAIGADKASVDFSREFVKKLKHPRQTVKVTLTVENH